MADNGTDSEAVSPPAGDGNAPGFGEAFTLDLNTGQASYAVDLTLPEGVANWHPKLKLEYRFLPVNGGYQSPEEIAAFGQLLSELPRPLVAFCRSGARSTRLFLAAQAG